jgi:hypothetical protein
VNRRFRPAPKPSRIIDEATRKRVVKNRDGICLWGLEHPGQYGPCSAGLDGHHIISRGSGGDDVEENLITLCRWHHIMAENHVIKPEELQAILRRRFHYNYERLPRLGVSQNLWRAAR